MENWLWILLLLIIGQRLVELVIAKKNERWMKTRGGVEEGQTHYKWFIWLHSLFFVSIIAEVYLFKREPIFSYSLLGLFILTQIARVWCIHSLGKFWNTKIIIIPGSNVITKGPYKYIKHPNYIIVAIELLIIPLFYGAYLTSIIFLFLHLVLLQIRIPKENEALERIID